MYDILSLLLIYTCTFFPSGFENPGSFYDYGAWMEVAYFSGQLNVGLAQATSQRPKLNRSHKFTSAA